MLAPTPKRTRQEKICWSIALIAAGIAVAPLVGGEFLGRGRFALVLIGTTAALSALLVIPYFRGRARVAAELEAGQELLAQWFVAEEDWLAWIDQEDVRERREKFRLLGLIFLFSVIIGGFFAVADSQAGPIVLASLLGVCALCYLALEWNSRRLRKLRRAGSREVRLSSHGLRLGHELHAWAGFGAKLEKIEFCSESPMRLVIEYSTRAKNQRELHRIDVPVPRSAESQAAGAAAQLQARWRC